MSLDSHVGESKFIPKTLQTTPITPNLHRVSPFKSTSPDSVDNLLPMVPQISKPSSQSNLDTIISYVSLSP